MSDIKMSDYFALPSNNMVHKINSNKTIKANCDGVSEFDAIDLAINSHDKLTEQNKLLREALATMVNAIDEHYADSPEFGNAYVGMVEALEATK